MKLIDCCDIQYGYPFDSKFFNDKEGFPLIRIRDVKRGFSETYTTEDFPKEYIVNQDDILVGMDGEFNVEKWGKVPAALNQRVCKIIPKDKISKDYVYYFLPTVLKKIEARTAFVTVKHLSAKELNKIEISLPNMETQQKIASGLNTLTSIISARKRQLEQLDLLVKSRFVEMFGDLVVNEKKWPITTIGEIAEIKIGPFGTLLHKEDYVPNCHALVNPSHIIDGKIATDSKLTVTDKKYEELSAYKLLPNDIVLGRRGEMGRCAVVTEKGLLCGTGSLIIRTNSKMKPFFLQNILSNPLYKKIIEDKAVGVTMQNLNVPIVSSLEVPLLPLPLQEQFAAFVAQADKSKSAVQKSLDQTQILFDSLMQEYFG